MIKFANWRRNRWISLLCGQLTASSVFICVPTAAEESSSFADMIIGQLIVRRQIWFF